MATLTNKKVNELAAGDELAAYSSSTGEGERFATPVEVVMVNRQSGSGDDGNFFVQLANDGNTPHNFVSRADDFVLVSTEDVETATVPDVIGETSADATTAIEGAGLVADATTVNTDDFTDGNVFVQVPAADSVVAPDSTVSIYVAAAVA